MLSARPVTPATLKASHKALLLDFDGVILRHPRALKHIEERIIDYVQINVYKGYLGREDARRLNYDLYNRYGHTHIGMKKLFLPFSHVSEFNDFVYDPAFLNKIYRDVVEDESLHKEIADFKRWLKTFKQTTGIPCYIFTNSPSRWSELWLMREPNQTHIHGIEDVFGSDHALFYNPADSMLKPNVLLYKNIEHHLLNSKKNPEQEIRLLMVDDSISNLEPITYNPRWVPIWFGKSMSNPAPSSLETSIQLSRLQDLQEFLV